MSKGRIPIHIHAELHFPHPDNLVYRGVTGNVSPTGAKLNRLVHLPGAESAAENTPVIKFFLKNASGTNVITLPCDLARSHRTGFGIQFMMVETQRFQEIGTYYQRTE